MCFLIDNLNINPFSDVSDFPSHTFCLAMQWIASVSNKDVVE